MTRLIFKSPVEVQDLIAQGATLIDIREHDEFARSHIAGAANHPLSVWGAGDALETRGVTVFTCRSGARTAASCDRLAAHIAGEAYVLDGGLDAWKRAGLPIETDRSAPIEIMRQVQIAAGSIVLFGVLFGAFVHPVGFGIAGFVGVGLTFAGVTGFCGMARLLMRAPWNRRAAV